MGYVKLEKSENPKNWTTKYSLGPRDPETREYKKVVRLGVPIELTDEEIDSLKARGANLVEVSEEEANAGSGEEPAPSVPEDLPGAAPSFGGSSKAKKVVGGNPAPDVKNS